MRILYLTNNPNLGSTARILQSWLTLGRQREWTGHVVAQSHGPFTQWLADNRIDYIQNRMPWFDKAWPFPSLKNAWQVARWAKRRDIDVIHCNEHNVYPFGLLLRRLFKRPLVCHVRFAIERPFCEWVFGGPNRQPDALLWTSRQQQQDCASAVAGLVPTEKQHLVYLGLNLNEFGKLEDGRAASRVAWGLKDNEIAIGTASAMKPIKRLEEFITLVAHLGAKHPHIVGVLAGDAPAGEEAYREHLLQRIKDTGLGRRFIWLGNQEPIEPFYHAVDLFVSTSEYETFGNSVCEAMACRKPVVAYRGGSVHEILGDAGVVVETGDFGTLTVEVDKLILDAERRHHLGEKARSRVAREFDPSQSFEKIEEIYISLLHRANVN